MNFLRSCLAPLGSAALLFLAFNEEWGCAVAHVALVPLLVHLHRGGGRFAVWLFGVSFAALYFFWLHIFTVLAPIVLTFVHSVWIFLGAVPYLILRRFGLRGIKLAVFGIAGWIASEWLRGLGPYGYEWGTIGYTQYGSLTIASFAHLGGVPLVSVLVLATNILIAWLIVERRAKMFWTVPLYLLALWALSPHRGLPLSVRAVKDFVLIQTNVSPYVSPLERDVILKEQLHQLALDSRRARAKNVILPETVFSKDITGMRGYLMEESRAVLEDFFHADPQRLVLVGAIEKDDAGFYNAAILFNADGLRMASYRKRHLVPFGESIPRFENIGWVQSLGEKLGTPFFSAGGTPAVMSIGDQRVAILICFEGTFSRLVAESAKDADLIINISNDAWSESKFGHAQHARFLRFRAIESGLPVIRVGNSGPTLLFAPNGKLILDIPHPGPAILDLSLVESLDPPRPSPSAASENP